MTKTTDTPVKPVASQSSSRPEAFTLKRRTLKLNGVPTSIAIEQVFWAHYDSAAMREGVPWHTVVARLLANPRMKGIPRASVLRVVAFRVVGDLLHAAQKANDPT